MGELGALIDAVRLADGPHPLVCPCRGTVALDGPHHAGRMCCTACGRRGDGLEWLVSRSHDR